MLNLNSRKDLGRIPTFVILAMSVFAISGGLVTIAGWLTDRQGWADWFGDGIAMFPNAALCVALLGCSCLMSLSRKANFQLFLMRLLAVTTLAIALATLSEHISGWNFGIDTLIVVRDWGQTASVSPMRMGIPASTSILVLSLSLILSTLNADCRRIASFLAVGSIIICSFSLIGYWFGVNSMFGIAAITAIARQTSILLVAIGISSVALIPEHGLHLAMARKDAGGTLLRRLILPALCVPIIVSLLKLQGIKQGYFDNSFGNALQVIVEAIIFLALLMLAVRRISKQSRLLDNAEKRLAMIVDNSDDAILSLGPDGKIQSWNEGAQRLFGYSSFEAIGQPIKLLIPECECEAETALIQCVLAGEKMRPRETKRVHKDGHVIDVSISTSPIVNAVGETIGMSKIVRDISERKRSEEIIQQASRNKDEFLATLAHELRNPLSPIASSLSLLGQKETNVEHQRELIELAERHLGQMVRLIDDLLDVSRISRGKIVLQLSTCSLRDVISRAEESVRAFCQEREHQLIIQTPPDDLFVQGDPARLTQIITNVLHNAAKYTPPGGHIEVNLLAANEDALIEVIDDGIGIPMEQIPKIFGLFTQLEHRDISGRGGLGVGLALVKQLVDLHQGNINVLSQGNGFGTCVQIRFPQVASPISANTVIPNMTENDVSKLATFPSCRVLVVDDMRANTFTLTKLLEKIGHTVQSANNGASALEIIEEFKPHVVISDISMSGMNGYELAEHIRGRWGDSIRLVALTGYGTEADRQQAEHHGFDTHMVKPPSLQALKMYFQSLCGEAEVCARRVTESNYTSPR